jgi:lysophospholipase
MTASKSNIRMETAPDGARLRIGHWQTGVRPVGTVILVHGRTEFLEKYAEVTAELNHRGLDAWAMDWRGQGLSDRFLNHSQKGHIDRFDTYIDDLVWFANDIIDPRAGPVVVLAHSMGGHIAVRAILEGALKPKGLIATAPMIALPMTRLGALGAGLLSRVVSGAGFGERYGPGMADYDSARVRFEDNPLTGDRDRFDRIHVLLADNPDFALGGVTWGWLNAAFRSMAEIRRLSRGVSGMCPARICTPMDDRVVSVDAQTRLSNTVGGWEQIRFEDARHELLMEIDDIRNRFWSAFDGFLRTL